MPLGTRITNRFAQDDTASPRQEEESTAWLQYGRVMHPCSVQQHWDSSWVCTPISNLPTWRVLSCSCDCLKPLFFSHQSDGWVHTAGLEVILSKSHGSHFAVFPCPTNFSDSLSKGFVLFFFFSHMTRAKAWFSCHPACHKAYFKGWTSWARFHLP